MAGTLIVNDNDDWLPPGWLFDSALRRIASHLPDDATALHGILSRADTSVSSYADLRKLDPRSFKLFIATADRAYDEVVSGGSAAFQDPSAFPAYLRWFDDLRAKLKRDPRAIS